MIKRPENLDIYSNGFETPAPLWKIIVGFILISASFLLVSTGFIGVDRIFHISKLANFNITPPQLYPSSTLFFLLSVVGWILGTALVLKLFHNKTLAVLFKNFNFRHFVRAGIITALFLLIAPLFVKLSGQSLTNGLPIHSWAIWLLPSIIVILLQIASEEIVFRGYLLQQLAQKFHSSWIWWIVPSALFGALHLDFANYGGNAFLVALVACTYGLFLADVTARTGNIAGALGIHFANNFISLSIFSPKVSYSSLALFYTPETDLSGVETTIGLSLNLLSIIAIYAGYRWIMWRFYRL